jgi:hypothetical protein
VKRLALAAVAVIALASYATATAAQTTSTAQSTRAPKPARTCLLPAFEVFSAKVWAPKRWERGAPPASTIEAAHRRIGCAPTSSHRTAMKRTWKRDRHAFYARRHLMLATRCGSPSCNVRLGWLIADGRGISRPEFDGCLVPLWDRESGWDETAWNSSSGAGGIPQGLPASKMGAAADPSIGGWEVAREQIEWGLDYLAERYDGPCGGWAHSNAAGWY